jgi:hypothetical protein
VTLTTDPQQKNGLWEVIGKVRINDPIKGKGELAWRVSFSRGADPRSPRKLAWTAVEVVLSGP